MLPLARAPRQQIRTFPEASCRRVATQGIERCPVLPLATAQTTPVRSTRVHSRFPDEVIQAPKALGVEFAPETENSIRVTVNVPAERCDDAYNKVIAELRKDYNVPGFRNNEKVPVDMLIQAAGGERQVKFACLEQVMHSTITEAFAQCPNNVIEGSVKVESDAEALVDQFQRNASLQYIVTAETGDLGVTFSAPYTGMQLEVSEVLNQTKEDEKVQQSITRFLRERGGSLGVAQRGAEMGDTLIIDFEVRNKATQEPIPSMDQARHELDCIAEENFLPGVMPKLMGMQVGEMKTLDFNFPDPWEPVELAGVEASVKVKIKEVLAWELPELTLEMCQGLQPDTTSIEQFMTELREAVRMQAKEELQARIQSSILEQLGKITMLERIPLAPFETFALGRYEGRLHEALENGVIKQEQLKELTTEETVKEYIDSQRATLEKEFAVLMAVDEIYKLEKLTIDETEVDKLIDDQREEFKKAGKITTIDQVKEYIRSELQQRTTLEFLQSNSDVTVTPLAEEKLLLDAVSEDIPLTKE